MSESNGPGKVTAKDGHVYHKSATANATTAPTNQHTIDNATQQGSMNSDELEFVTIIHYEYGLKGELPDLVHLKKEYGYSESEYKALIGKDKIKAALQERGVELRAKHYASTGLSPVGIAGSLEKHAKLSPLQLIVANAMLDLTDTKSEKKKLQDLGINTAKYQMWMRDPDFREYLKERAEALIGDVQHEAMLSLVDQVKSGNMKAIQYYHELTGRFTPRPQTIQGASPNQDLQGVITRIIEIIVDEVEDQDTMLRISDKLKGLIMGHQVSSAFSEPIVQPEIAVAREQTDEVKELMARGVGYND